MRHISTKNMIHEDKIAAQVVKKNTILNHPELKMKDPGDESRRELETILRFTALINSSLRIEDVLNYAMEWAEEFIDAEASTVYELDEEKSELFIRIARGEKKESVERIKFELGQGISGHVVQTGQPMVIQDVRKEKRFSPKFDRITGFHTRSMICVPLILRGKTIGALQVLNKKSGDLFTQIDVELLTSMSQQIAVAMENAKLYRRLEKRFELNARELKTAQDKLILSERLVAMSHLVQGVAHEIRNPVTTIGGFARRIKKILKRDPEVDKYLNAILEESERLESLVRQVHEYTSVLAATLALDDIRATLHEVVNKFEPIAQQQGVSLVTKIDESLPLTRMASSQIMTALSNIMENALESMPNGGKLVLEAKQRNSQLFIKILDTGHGIRQEYLNSVYDPFFSSKTHGAGLGLAVVYQIVKNHDGEITIQSQEGKGTSVTIQLPVRR
ncbi:MAG: GAF domain-containing sensor histidine kinase [Desulfobacteraceae bacterium]|nr:MAG: GAF domain-containing sensor histidine kinase [Desulfobacteraceae bacterium]